MEKTSDSITNSGNTKADGPHGAAKVVPDDVGWLDG